MRLVIFVVLVSLFAGCASVPGTTEPPPAVRAAPVIVAPDATLESVGDTTIASWSGALSPLNRVPVVGAPDPTTPSANAKDFAVTLPTDVTAIHGWLNFSGGATMSLLVLNDTNRRMCGETFVGEAPAECFMTLYRAPAKALEWRARVQLDDASGKTDYTLQIAFSSRDLPILGSPAPFGAGAAQQFGPSVLVDANRHTGEPSIAVTPKGTIYIAAPTGAQESLWRSDDNGATFTFVPIHNSPTDPGAAYPVGGGDSDVVISGENTIYFSDQQGGSGETVSSSHDGGKTWFTTPLAAGPPALPGTGLPLPIGAPTGIAYSADRQWLVTDGELTAWMGFNSRQGATVVKTLDGGRTWPIRAFMQEDNCFRGNLARAPDGTLYFAGCDNHGPGVGVSTDGGLSFTWKQVAQRDGETETSFIFPAHIFVIATTDAKGNAYVVWSDEAQTPEATGAPPGGARGLNVWLSSSTDKGSTWSLPKKVNQMAGTYVQPWATGGADGTVAVAYYATKFEGNPERAMGEWYPVVAIATDATSENPTWKESTISEELVQYGPICMRGSACGGARNLLDFFQIQADTEGQLHVTYTDGRAGISARLSNIMYAGQIGGMTLGGPSVDRSK